MHLLTVLISFLVLDLFGLTPLRATTVKLAACARGRDPSKMDLNRLVKLGKELSLEGEDLRTFVSEGQERVTIERKEKQAEEREARAQLLEIKREERETAELQLKLQVQKSQEMSGQKTGSKSFSPKLPHFDDEKDELDAYLQRFERYATAQSWSKSNWAVNLSALLRGKALAVYSRLSIDESSEYSSLKDALLKRYNLTEEGTKRDRLVEYYLI